MDLPRPRSMPAAAALLAAALLASLPARAFDLDDVEREAIALASNRYRPPENRVPRALRDLSYDQYRSIRYLPDKAAWRGSGLPFEIMFFHAGFYYAEPVRIAEIVGQRVQEFPFSSELFDYGKSGIDTSAIKNAGFAGFRIHYALNTPRYKDEVLVFLGASYFRALGKGQRYGLSARGLAIDTGLPSGEEFPRFVRFWIQRPTANARELTIYALLDSRRAAGAYRFVLRPGVSTEIDVRARLWLREQVTALGIAPLTSMYLFGENQKAPADDFRPEVHDSDGLAIYSGTGEWIFRPLVNPKRLLMSSFALANPQGFGLSQRDRNFDDYQDLESRFERRPGAWVTPLGAWGEGRIQLVELPTPTEFNDNIVAFWVPTQVPKPRERFQLDYRISWEMERETRPPQAFVAQSRRGVGPNHGPNAGIGFVIDFEGPALRSLPRNAPFDAVVTLDGNADLLEQVVYRNEVTGGARLTLRLRRRDDAKPVEMRAFLTQDGATMSETWSYLLPPD